MHGIRKNIVRQVGSRSALVALLAIAAAGSPLLAREGKTPPAKKAKPSLEKKAAPLSFLQRPEQKAARAEVEASGLAPALKKKLVAGDPLSLAEIEKLGDAGLNPELVIKCLRTAGGSYELLTKDIDRLRTAGLADSVLDYLLTTRSRRLPFDYSPYLYFGHSWLHHDDHHFDDLLHSHTHDVHEHHHH